MYNPYDHNQENPNKHDEGKPNQNNNNKPWYTKWWGLLIILAIVYLLFEMFVGQGWNNTLNVTNSDTRTVEIMEGNSSSPSVNNSRNTDRELVTVLNTHEYTGELGHWELVDYDGYKAFKLSPKGTFKAQTERIMNVKARFTEFYLEDSELALQYWFTHLIGLQEFSQLYTDQGLENYSFVIENPYNHDNLLIVIMNGKLIYDPVGDGVYAALESYK